LSGRELAALAEELVNTKDSTEAEALKTRIVAGFYGDESDA
jgi:hypothetical protein